MSMEAKMVRVIAVMVAFLSSVQLAQACLSPGEEIYDPGEYVARFTSVRACPMSGNSLWQRTYSPAGTERWLTT